jgi:hypothetical protein
VRQDLLFLRLPRIFPHAINGLENPFHNPPEMLWITTIIGVISVNSPPIETIPKYFPQSQRIG